RRIERKGREIYGRILNVRKQICTFHIQDVTLITTYAIIKTGAVPGFPNFDSCGEIAVKCRCNRF
ncbi:MAG: hypothetical protein ABH886_10675, partial [Candidatus Desantisbacteria bacterium]